MTPWPLDAGIRHRRGIDGRPVRIAGDAALVADPAHVGARVGEDHRVAAAAAARAPRRAASRRPAASRSGLRRWRRRTRPRAIGPYRVSSSVSCVAVEIVVARRVAVRRLVAIPRRADTARPQSSARQASTNSRTTSPLPPRNGLRATEWRVVRARPEAEAVVMLRGEHHRAESRRRARRAPTAARRAWPARRSPGPPCRRPTRDR